MAKISAADFARGLKGAHFPASKDDLVDLARENGVEDEIIETMEDLPEDEFASVAEVEKAFGQLNRSEGGRDDMEEEEETHSPSAKKGGQHSHGGRSRS